MKRKLFSLVLALLLVLSAFLLFGCSSDKPETKEITVEYYVDAVIYHSQTVTDVNELKLPEPPTKDGYTFDGWFLDNGKWESSFNADNLTASVIVYAKFTENTTAGGGEESHTHIMQHHAAVSATCLSEGSREYWSCSGCNKKYSDANGVTEIESTVTEMLTHNFIKGACTHCGEIKPFTQGLSYNLINGGAAYEVTGIGTATDTDIVIPEIYEDVPVTSIGESAFEECTEITSIELPPSVTDIGMFAFYSCNKIQKVYISDTAAWFNISFEDCYANPLCYKGNLYLNGELVKALTIPNTVEAVKPYTLYGCAGLRSITVPSSVKVIGEYAFFGCPNLAEIKLEASSLLERIERYAFHDCKALTAIELPSGVTEIGTYAFEHCDKLTEVYNRSSLNITAGSNSNGYIGYYALNVYTPKKGESRLEATSDGYIFYSDGSDNYLLGYSGDETALTLPESYKDGSYKIYKFAFYYCKTLTSIKMPSGITGIGESAFDSCTALTEVEISASAVTIENYAFYSCENLIDVKFGEESLLEIIGSRAFNGCNRLTGIELPPHLTTIGESAFRDCINLTSINIPSRVTSIGISAFYNCEKLVEVYNCSSLTITKGSEGNGYSGYYALNIYTPTSGTTKLETTSDGYIFYSDGVNSYLLGYSGGESAITLPDGYKGGSYTIYKFAFYGYTNLTSITMQQGITAIATYAFNNCIGLTEMHIPSSVTEIGPHAFNKCESLTKISFEDTETWYFNSSNEHFGGTAFDVTNYIKNATCFKATLSSQYWYKK